MWAPDQAAANISKLSNIASAVAESLNTTMSLYSEINFIAAAA